MSELTPDIAAMVVEACQAGAEETAAALGRALDGEFSVSVGESSTYATDSPPDGFSESGLAVLLKIGDTGAAVIIPESSGLLPDWIRAPDVTGQSRLDTLAQELGMLLVPAELMPDEFRAAQVPELVEALGSAEVADEAALVPLELKRGDQQGQLSLIWPLNCPDLLLGAKERKENTAEAAASAPTNNPSSARTFADLPSYSRSLLKVQVPVSVVLASRKESLKDVVELSPGTLLKFDKACDELLNLFVGDQQVAEGEAVKVGDKFGFRVLSMSMPEEHFWKVQRERAS